MTTFPFSVGDKVRRPNWSRESTVTITAIGAVFFLATTTGDPADEDIYRQGSARPSNAWVLA